MIGMNDARIDFRKKEVFRHLRTGYQHIVESVKRICPASDHGDSTVAVDDVTQPPKFEGGYNAVLVRYRSICQELADREKTERGPILNARRRRARKGQGHRCGAGKKDYSRPASILARVATYSSENAENLRSGIFSSWMPDARTKNVRLKSGTRFPGPNSTRPCRCPVFWNDPVVAFGIVVPDFDSGVEPTSSR